MASPVPLLSSQCGGCFTPWWPTVHFGVHACRDEGQAKVVELQQLGSEAEGRAREQAEATQHLAYYLTKLEETQGKVGRMTTGLSWPRKAPAGSLWRGCSFDCLGHCPALPWL